MEQAKRLTTVEIVERLARYDGPPEQFLHTLLSVQCRLSAAMAGAILRVDQEGKVNVLAANPPMQKDAPTPVWLSKAAELSGNVVDNGRTIVIPLPRSDEMYGQPVNQHMVVVPLRGGSGVRGVAAFLIEATDPQHVLNTRERLELSVGLLSLYEMRLTLQRRQSDMGRMRDAMETLAAVNSHNKFQAAAMAAVNEIASRWNCDRVSLGVLKGRYVHLKALSHTEKFSRRMELVQSVESVMEECLDQDLEVFYPSPPTATFVSRAAAKHGKKHGSEAILSVPLRSEGEVLAVITLERSDAVPFTQEQVESLRLTAEMITPRLLKLHDTDRWFGARAAATARKGLGVLVGPRHTWAKIAAVAVLGAIIFLAFARGTHYAEAPFVLQAQQRRAVHALVRGELESLKVQPGQTVQKGQLLALLDHAELEDELEGLGFKRRTYLNQADTSLSQGKTAEWKSALDEAAKVAAEIELIKKKITDSQIRSPIDGTVIRAVEEDQLTKTFKPGEVLFEVAPLENLRAELSLPEDLRHELRVGQKGEIQFTGRPDEQVPVTVERISPMAQGDEKENVYKVRVSLPDDFREGHRWVDPGMEGLGRIELGERRYVYIWTRPVVNWVRMKLWW